MPRNYHIMVVEDDLAVRQIMTHQIRQAGYRASDFTTGKRAIDALNEMQARGQSIDLLVLD
ncbi:MAG: DNA-binding response regulator, partial [Candidatus Sumerlaeota bacterium]